MTCAKCGLMSNLDEGICAGCGTRTYVLEAEPGVMEVVGYPVGIVVEGPPDDPAGRRVDSQPASGGRSLSSIDAKGQFEIDLSGSLDRGRSGEARILKVLTQALRAAGSSVERLSGARDSHGEDGLLIIDGNNVPVQIVSLPVIPQMWRDFATRGMLRETGDKEKALQWVRAAVEHKRTKAVGALLALDASQIAAIVNTELIATYLGQYGDPVSEFSFQDVWIVGPSVRSTFRLRP